MSSMNGETTYTLSQFFLIEFKYIVKILYKKYKTRSPYKLLLYKNNKNFLNIVWLGWSSFKKTKIIFN